MRKALTLLVLTMLTCVACQWKFRLGEGGDDEYCVRLERYDRVESQYLTTGDFAALQQMNTEYPTQTRTLIEDILKLGRVNDPEINVKFLHFYQDTTLQQLVNAVEQEFANVDDLNKELSQAFKELQKMIPSIKIPTIYTQIGALDQSIIVGNGEIGISLDKYLGRNFPLYYSFYNEQQRKTMTRDMIVPDCLVFYLVSLYPMPNDNDAGQMEHDIYMARILWTTNKAIGRKAFASPYIKIIDAYVGRNHLSPEKLLTSHDYQKIVKESGIKYE